nr:hypothetical protein [Massilia timonae]
MQEAFAHIACRHVAAIEQQVGAFRQCAAQHAQVGCMIGQAGLGQARRAKLQHAGSAVRKHMDRLDSAAAGQCRGDLRHAVAGAVDQHRLHTLSQAIQERLVAGDGRIDEGDFTTAGARLDVCCCSHKTLRYY